jgi:hypothetical protein
MNVVDHKTSNLRNALTLVDLFVERPLNFESKIYKVLNSEDLAV